MWQKRMATRGTLPATILSATGSDPSSDAIAREGTLRALYELAVAAGGERDPSVVARLAVEQARELLGVDGAVVLSFDTVTGLLQPMEETKSGAAEPLTMPGEGAAGLAFQSGRPVRVADYRTWRHAIPQAAGRGMVSGMAVPLAFEQRPIGALGVWTYAPRAFGPDDVRLLSLFAAQIAPVLESARLTRDAQSTAEMFQALHEVAVAAAGLIDSASLAALAVDRARRMLGADGVGIWWWVAAKAALVRVTGQAMADDHDSTGVVNLCYEKRRAVIIDDYQAWREVTPQAPASGVRTSFAVPLTIGDRCVGVICVWSHSLRRILPRDVHLLGLFASQVAPALDSARLSEEAASRGQTFEALHELAVAAGGVLDPHSLAGLAADRARDLLQADSAGVVWWDPEARVMRPLADNGSPELEPRAALPGSQGVIGVAFSRREPVSVGDPSAFPEADIPALRMGIRSVAAVPLLVGDRAVGALVARSRELDYFGLEQTRLMALVAAQVAPAMESARLAEERGNDARRFRLLHQMAVSASGVLEPVELANRAVGYARELLGGDDATLVIWSPAEAVLKTLADSSGVWLGAPPPAPGQGVLGVAFLRREAVVVDDYQAWEHATEQGRRHGIASAAGVPLMAGDRAIGALTVTSRRRSRYGRDRIQLLALLGAQVAPALEAARLYGDLSRSEERFRSLYQTIACGVLVQGPDGVVRDGNPTAEEICGVPLAEMRGLTSAELWEVLDENGQPGTLRRALLALESRRPVRNFLLTMRRRDGSVRYVQADSIPVLDGAGEPVQVVSSFLDITEMQHAEAALRESEGRFRAVFDRAAIGIARLDLTGVVVEPSPALCQMLGYEAADLVGSHVRDHVEPEDFPTNVWPRLAAGEAEVAGECRCLRRDGGAIWASTVTSLVRNEEGEPQFAIVMVEDITERKAWEEALEHQALHDALTGLPNRSLLHDRLQQAIEVGRRGEQSMALLMMDLDRFKDVNDTFGHHAGDVLLGAVAVRLRSELRASDTVARLGGDEFAIVLAGVDGEGGAERAARKLLRALELPFQVEGESLHIGASIGMALFPDHGADGDLLMRHADIAMYVAKRAGSGCSLYSPDEDTHSPNRLALVGELRHAAELGQFELHYQPKVEMASLRVTGVEALVRWRHPRHGLLAPDEFIPLAEHSGLIRALGLWVIEAALRQSRLWSDQGLDLKVAVNLSMRSLHDPQLPETLAGLLQGLGVVAGRLQVEITESTLMGDPERAQSVLGALAAMGVELSIDDFGTGYSSLSYLRRLPVRELKIDKSFVLDMACDLNAAVIVRSTADLGHNLGLSVVAEGVEDRRTWQMAADMGCDLAQGHLIGRPQPAASLTRQLLKSRTVAVPA